MSLLITLAIMAAIIFLFAGIFQIIGPDKDVEERLEQDEQEYGSGSQSSGLGNRVNRQLAQAKFGSRLAMELAQAGAQLTPAEFIAINIGMIVGSLLLGLLIAKTIVAGLALSVVAAFGPRFWLKRKKDKRMSEFQQQLPDVLNLIVGSLRAGYGLIQAMKLVSQEMPSPSKDEYTRVVNEISLGYSLQQALAHLVERMESEDLLMVVTAINIQNEVGGNLGNILESIAATIRDRVKLEGDIRTLTSMQRMTGYMLAAMPFFVAVILLFMNPEYIMQMFVFPWYAIPIGAVISMGLGLLLMNKLTQMDI
ncbi:MAG: type II secretion system F family protein [Caldilineaceae bacterium]|nr:type II secretion system F family protein [Caldilineaceae bacterium]